MEDCKRLLFVHDGEKIKIDDKDNYYTDGSYNEEVWKRYEYLSEDITVIFRKENRSYEEMEARSRFQPFNKNKYKLLTINDIYNSLMEFMNIRLRIENKKLIKEEVKKSDYIIARVPSDASYTAIKYARKYNKKCLLEVVGCPFDALWNHGIKGKILSIFKYYKLKKNIKKQQYVMYVTEEFLQKRYPTKGKNIACSDVVLEESSSEILSNRLEKIKSMNSRNKIVLGTIGNVDVKYKGQDDVIKAINILSNKGIDIEYRLVGGGDTQYLKEIAKKHNVEEHIVFMGSVVHSKIFEFLDNIDIYIQPSRTEGLCRAFIEAISRGCPCIASQVGGNPELIDKEFLFKKCNIQGIVDKVSEILEENNMLQQARNNYNNSKKYNREVLKNKRNSFYDLFIKE